MHPAIVEPAIAAALADLAGTITSHRQTQSALPAGSALISFNPHTNGPGGESLPIDATHFAFWEIADEESFSTFMEGLSIQLDMLDLPWEAYSDLPLGYGIARYVLRFETHCKFSAWMAIENVGADGMVLTRRYYRAVGLDEEAAALEKAEDAWYAAGGHPEGYDYASNAYESVPNPHRDEDQRWFFVLAKLRDAQMWELSEA